MKGIEYGMTVRDQHGTLLHQKKFPFNKAGRIFLKAEMKAEAAKHGHGTVVRGSRLTGAYSDVQWYCVCILHTVHFAGRIAVSNRTSQAAKAIHNFLKSEDDWADEQAERDQLLKDMHNGAFQGGGF